MSMSFVKLRDIVIAEELAEIERDHAEGTPAHKGGKSGLYICSNLLTLEEMQKILDVRQSVEDQASGELRSTEEFIGYAFATQMIHKVAEVFKVGYAMAGTLPPEENLCPKALAQYSRIVGVDESSDTATEGNKQ